MSRKRNPRRRTVSRIDRSSSVRQSKQLTFEQLEARHLLATFVVNSTADGPVDLTDSVVTLRDAIASSNDTAGADTITFDPSVFSSAQTIDLTSELPTITDDVTITGPGADLLTIDAGNGTDGVFDTGDGFRILSIDDDDENNLIDVELSGLTISGGDQGGFMAGGGISNSESLLITGTTISGNSASYGGGIYNNFDATLTITSSTISGNAANYGGGIANLEVLSISSSTISNNTAESSGGGIDSAAALSTFTLTSSTVTGNSAGDADGGGGIDVGSVGTVTNSIIANSPSGGDIGLGPAGEGGVYGDFNLVGDGLNVGGFPGVITGDPLLGPLADNGGPTLTHALLPGSPAIDAGDDSVTETEDQRGLTRNVNGVDIGAFEVQGDGQGDILSVTSFARDEGGAIETLARPDLLNQVAVEFSADVSISADDLVIRNDTLGGTLVDTSGLTFSYDASTQTATWDFSSLTLDAGFYSFELSSDIASVDGSSSLGGAFIEPVHVVLP